jgi:hypothetical protein
LQKLKNHNFLLMKQHGLEKKNMVGFIYGNKTKNACGFV